MQTKDLKDVLKDSQTVTSLDSTDRVIAMDSNGNPKTITEKDLVDQQSLTRYSVAGGDGRWIRIAKMTEYGSACVIGVSMIGFSSGWHFPVIMTVVAPHGSSLTTMSIKPLHGARPASVQSAKYPFSKIRITGNEGTKYLDIYVETASAERRLFVSLGMSLGCSLVSPVENPDLQSTTKEFLVTDLWGGE